MDPVTPPETPASIGPYRLEELLGRGGMGEVYLAVDQRLKRRVAIKHIRPEATLKRTALERFRREASLVARLSHPAVVQIFDVVENETGYWIVMEFIDGPTLTAMTTRGALDLDLALSYGRQVAEGLAEAHDKGILHRDLKTENVMVTPSGHVKILDFGLAKQIDKESGEHSLTVRGEILGTGRSMSPEQARGLELDARSDLFSLGVLLYELLTGRAPFRGRTVLDTLTKVTSSHQAPVVELVPSVPKPVSDLVDRLLEKAPELRPHSARQVALELEEMRLRHANGSATYGASPSYAAASTHLSQPSPVHRKHDDLPESDAVVRTLVVSDLVGSTRLFEELGDRRALEIGKRHDALARNLLGAHNGREIDKGDGFLLIFRRPIDAVAWALDYHHDLQALSKELGHAIEARVGIHLGEVFLRENPPSDVARGAKPLEVEGLAKSMAAHVMSLATGGQTLMSRGAYDLAHRASQSGTGELDEDTEWLRHGAYRVDGLSEPLEIFEAGSPDVAPLRPPDGERVASGSTYLDRDLRPWPEPTEATRDFRFRRLGLGLAGLLILVVAFVWWWLELGSGNPRPPEQAAKSSDSLVGETAEEAYERATHDLKFYDSGDRLETAIGALKTSITRKPESAPAHAELSYAYWRKYIFSSNDRIWLVQAEALAEKATTIDPFYARGWVSLALTRIYLGSLDAAKTAIDRALVLDPRDPRAQIVLAKYGEKAANRELAAEAYARALEIAPSDREILDSVAIFYFRGGRFEEAENLFKRSIAQQPEGALAPINLSGLYYMQGDFAKATRTIQTLLEVNPNPTAYSNLGTYLFYQGLYLDAADAFRKATEFDYGSNSFFIWVNLADAQRWAGLGDEAEISYRRGRQLLDDQLKSSPDSSELISHLALLVAKMGDETRALSLIEELKPEALRSTDPRLPARLGQAAELAGDRSGAIALLGAAISAGYPTEEIDRNPELTALRADPRFFDLTRSSAESK